MNRILPLGVFLVCGWTSAALAQARESSARVVVDASRVEGPISPQLYGQFIEFMFGGVKSGIHAEMLRDRGFDDRPSSIGLPRYWERYPDDRDDDYALHFRWDDSVAYPVSAQLMDPSPVQHSLRVDAGSGVFERHGIFQARVPVTAGSTYRGYVWMRTSGYNGPVIAALEQDSDSTSVYAQDEISGIAGGWKKYEFVLRSRRSDPVARFAILFPGKGTVWLDQVSLMSHNAVGGVRRDVFERVRGLRPAFIRWPGGNVAQDYHWQWGVGPRDQRPTWVNMSWGNEPEPGDFGTDEFIAFSRAVGAEPSLTINVEGRGATPEEAAAWVEYCNGPASSRYGALRAANGHPEPYRVKYWELGNEIWGSWVRGHSDAVTYARNFQRYRDAMRAVDPAIRFIAVGDNDMAWNRAVLAAAGRGIDYLAVHHYYGGDSLHREVHNLMARPLYFERFYRDLSALARELVPDHSIGLAINEWGLDLSESRQYSMDAALYGARLMNVFERSSPSVAMSAVSDMVNGWPGGIIQAGRTGVFVSPLYHVNRLYATHLGAERLRTSVESPTYDTNQEGRTIPALDAVTSRSRDGKTIFLKLVNTDSDRDLRVRFEISGADVSGTGERELLYSVTPRLYNSFLTPNAIEPRRESITTGRAFTLALPARSVSVVTLHVAQ